MSGCCSEVVLPVRILATQDVLRQKGARRVAHVRQEVRTRVRGRLRRREGTSRREAWRLHQEELHPSTLHY